ncbi:carboxypeptidase-like regulatory domain-containing protein [Sphingobacterium sp. SGG-5]|uniref:DUF5686 and carboxypeptidase-like regulatory domain-containing protein n=1 Tax=Sphingobacterium sp. SGG-5 TaxID=2710881 RepID=UPI0013EE2412|nr:DUF5686 and carboxypeptidase-like regulatory domain-containing protein [Sphingobacterium sp. SGG-5]NGM62072.1 carboxypeptidase-like regulatory domain-containing protein [Sphingobacterium sp. SGG-5]
MKINLRAVLYVLTLFVCTQAFGQTLDIRGRVLDAQTKEAISFATVAVVGSSHSTYTDDNGNFNLVISDSKSTVRVSYVGYISQDLAISPKNTNFQILLQSENVIEEVVVKKPRLKYSNKNNPAVELIRQVIAHRDSNRMAGQEFVQYEQYEKISLGLSNLTSTFKNKKIFKKYQFLFKKDSESTEDKYILPAYIEEKVSKIYYRKDPQKTKQYILAEQRAEFDPKFVDNNGISNYFNKLYEHIDIYDNDITLLTNQFLSPIANSAPTFYRFYITDTIKTAAQELVELSFFPRNKADLLFQGKLYITLDGQYAVQEVKMEVNEDINLNFVRDLQIELAFARDNRNKYYLNKSSLGIDFALTEKGKGIRGNRIVYYKDYISGKQQPDSIYAGEAVVKMPLPAVEESNESYWANLRFEPLSPEEQNIYRNIDSLQLMSSFRRIMDIGSLVLAGYKQAGPVEIGPVNTFYSYNPVEGFRLRVGGRTTDVLSTRFYSEAYAAYGFLDQKWKYFLSGTYSLNNKSIYTFPQHYIRASFQRDTKIPGQNLEFVQEDNIFLSLKRGENESYLYNDIYRVDYKVEFKNNFSVAAGLSKWKQQPAGVLKYKLPGIEGGMPSFVHDLHTTEASVGLRWAPHEEYYQGKSYRKPFFNKYPIFTLNYTAGIKGFLDGQYSYHNLNAGVFKRVYLSQFGYADVNLDGAYILGSNLPFPLLTIHRANQTYAYQLQSYNLMNFLEFVSDHHAALNVQYYMNGFLLNKIPLLKRLQLREVFSVKGVYGGLRRENNPSYNDDVFAWQTNSKGEVSSFTFGTEPYMEASVGLSNIFKILRIDMVKRLNYLDHPSVSEWGLRARVKFDF